MKFKFLLYTLLIGLLTMWTTDATAQNLLEGGGMEAEDEEAWNFVDHTAIDDDTEEPMGTVSYEFGFEDATPSEGEGGALDVDISGSTTDFYFWQELTLDPGTYEFDGAFRELMNQNVVNPDDERYYWIEALVTENDPEEGGLDFGDAMGGYGMLGFHNLQDAWLPDDVDEPCGPGIDGTFQEDACVGEGPLTIEEETTLNFVLKIGFDNWAENEQGELRFLFSDFVLEESTDTSAEPVEQVSDFTLNQNYPNPFNPTTEISYHLPESESVQLEVYDMLGRHIETLVDETQNRGAHTATFDAADLTSGVYMYRLQAGDYTETRKMQLVR